MSNWFSTLGWWQQKEAYQAFDQYRSNPTKENFDNAVVLAIPIIRVVMSTQKFKTVYIGDVEDLVSHAALIITKAVPKMVKKPVENLNNDKKYMRYLFTCVVYAFYREYDILHGKHNKLQRKINNNASKLPTPTPLKNLEQLEIGLTLNSLPTQLLNSSVSMIRFENNEKSICVYILQQIMEGREISKAVLHLLGCKNRAFFTAYCNNLLYRAFLGLKDTVREGNVDYEEFDEENDALLPLLEWEPLDYEDQGDYTDGEESYGEEYAY